LVEEGSLLVVLFDRAGRAGRAAHAAHAAHADAGVDRGTCILCMKSRGTELEEPRRSKEDGRTSCSVRDHCRCRDTLMREL
jgi:hypothetical protein